MVYLLKAQSLFFVVRSSSGRASPYPVVLVTIVSLSLATLVAYYLWVLFREGFYYSLYLLLPFYIFTHFFLVGLKTLLRRWS